MESCGTIEIDYYERLLNFPAIWIPSPSQRLFSHYCLSNFKFRGEIRIRVYVCYNKPGLDHQSSQPLPWKYTPTNHPECKYVRSSSQLIDSLMMPHLYNRMYEKIFLQHQEQLNKFFNVNNFTIFFSMISEKSLDVEHHQSELHYIPFYYSSSTYRRFIQRTQQFHGINGLGLARRMSSLYFIQ